MAEQQRSWGPESSGCQLSITSAKRQFQRSEPVNLDITFRNNGPATVRLARVSEWFDLEWTAQRSDGSAVPLSDTGKQQRLALQAGGGGTLVELAAGKQVTSLIDFAEVFDVREGGQIEIQVVRKALDAGGSPFQVVSNVLKIAIQQ